MDDGLKIQENRWWTEKVGTFLLQGTFCLKFQCCNGNFMVAMETFKGY